MLRSWQRLTGFLWRKLGSCPYCIRKAFQAAAGAWAFALLVLALGWSSASLVLAIIALGLTALWIAHLVTYAVRVVLHWKRTQTAAETSRAVVITSSRRDLLPVFARAIAAAVLTSTVTPSAFAAGWGACGSGPCTSCYRPYYDNSGGPGTCIWCHSCAINGCVGTVNC
jgi:hypothetical protein